MSTCPKHSSFRQTGRQITGRLTTGLTIAALILAPLVQTAQAAQKPLAPPEIPTRPSAPAPFAAPKAVEPFRCERFFVYQGKEIRCDSIVRQDAERLRPILQPVPEAIAELNVYQQNRRDIRKAAYMGSAGLLIATVAFLVAQNYRDSAAKAVTIGDVTAQQAQTDKANIYKALAWGGLGLTGGTVIYGVSLLRTNELHLGNAVQKYNDARPDDPIQLQFTTGITF